MKVCGKCKETKPLTEFFKDKTRSDGLTYRCKACQTADNARYTATPAGKANAARRHEKWRKNNLEHLNTTQRAYYKNNPARYQEYERKAHYGVAYGTYDAMLAAQDGKCAICKTETPGGKGAFHIDHCHSSKEIRGLLCHHCNLMLGNAKDSVHVLEAAARYLTINSQVLPEVSTESRSGLDTHEE